LSKLPKTAPQVFATADVLLVVTPGVLLLDLAALAEPLRIANRLAVESHASPPPFALHIVAHEKRTTASLPMEIAGTLPLPKRIIGSAENPTWIMLSGVTTQPVNPIPAAQVRAANAATILWLKMIVAPAIASGHARLLTACSGALIAAQANLLDDRQCTTHHDLTKQLREQHPRARVQENRVFVIDGPIATSAGITAGLDLTLAAIAAHCGPALASAVARDMVVYWRRAGADPQHSPLLAHRNHLHAAVHRAQDAVIANPSGKWTVEILAEHAYVSSRHLRRLFTDNAGIAPLAYVQSVRVALARELIASEELSMEQAATRAGFSSARQLRDAWKSAEKSLAGDAKNVLSFH
jgi:transcriptional regulator GlxA family with amidase domain